jgi:hypothetical protein
LKQKNKRCPSRWPEGLLRCIRTPRACDGVAQYPAGSSEWAKRGALFVHFRELTLTILHLSYEYVHANVHLLFPLDPRSPFHWYANSGEGDDRIRIVDRLQRRCHYLFIYNVKSNNYLNKKPVFFVKTLGAPMYLHHLLKKKFGNKKKNNNGAQGGSHRGTQYTYM